MARFIYKMQNILNIKEKLEEQEKQNFALMRVKLTEEEDKLAALKDRRNAVAEEGKKMREDKINILSIKENTALASFLDEQIKGQSIKVMAAEKNLENARVRMQNAIQERKIHEKLKENAFDEFIKEEGMKEAKEIDELTSYVYGQKEE